MSLTVACVPAQAGTHTIYMRSVGDCGYSCSIVRMQVKGSKVRFQVSQMMAGGVGSIGWMTRRGNEITGWVGGDCVRDWDTRQVTGSPSRTHFPDMVVVTKRQAEAYARNKGEASMSVPDWPWQSQRKWREFNRDRC